MELINFTLALASLASLQNILIVAIGLGLVIFFHELGHFLVAKWCGVYVERFSIGFGQPILARKWGETEYALGWLPFGGYVKMLGQDDMDPGQMTDDQVAENPRSYTAKSVPQRMAIISAGVIMNIITGMLFFVLVFSWGIMKPDRVVGGVQVGMPAWKAGIRTGDVITAINGRAVNEYDDLIRGTVLSSGPIILSGYHDDGQTFDLKLQPEKEGIRKIIGVLPARSLTIFSPGEGSDYPVSLPGTPADAAGFAYGDEIVAVDGQPVSDNQELLSILNAKVSQTVSLQVRRVGKDGKVAQETIELPPENFISFGLKMGMGRIVALRDGSIAERAGLKTGDRIAKVNGMDVESDLDPFRLTETFSANAGQEVSLTVTREVPGGSPETLTLTLVPEARNPWSEPPIAKDSPLSIPSIGAAYHLVPTVFSVAEGSPAAAKQISPRDTVTRLVLTRAEGSKKDGLEHDSEEFVIGEKNWAHAFWALQENGRTRLARLTVKPANASAEKTVDLKAVPVSDWYLPTDRGLLFNVLMTRRQAANFGQALAMGGQYTLNSIEDIYLTLRGLFTRDISPTGLSGPIGIAKVAYSFASVGLPHFVLFLGLISINLAVINFLPIPVLDGGHMVFLLWEGIFRRKPSEKVIATATYCGLAFVLGLMVFVIYLDLFVTKR